jgi:hypothetical protein
VSLAKEGEPVLEDEGIFDKRLLIDEREFYQVLSVIKRDGNTLSRVVRELWDRGGVESITKHSPARTTNAHLSIVGHITEEELRRNLDHTAMLNGFANRFLFIMVKRSKLLPHGGATLDEVAVNDLAIRTRAALNTARQLERVTMTADAAEIWEGIYEKLSAGRYGLAGAACGRAEAQTIRLALIYALLDCTSQIDVRQLRAGLAIWSFAEQSAVHIFGDLIGDPIADDILKALRSAGPDGLTRTQISNLFDRHHTSSKITAALAALATAGKAKPQIKGTPGKRPTEIWIALAKATQ